MKEMIGKKYKLDPLKFGFVSAEKFPEFDDWFGDTRKKKIKNLINE